MEKLLKALLVFWGVVITIIVIRFILVTVNFGTLFPDMKNVTQTLIAEVSNYVDRTLTEDDQKTDSSDKMQFTLEENREMVLPRTKSCTKNGSAHFEPKYLNTASQCFNGDCTLSVSFRNEIPEKVGLYVQEGPRCVEKYFEVAPHLQISGYRIDLQLNPEQKAALGIHSGDTVRLRQSDEYELDPTHQYFFYDTALASDDVMVNGEKKGTVFFRQKQ